MARGTLGFCVIFFFVFVQHGFGDRVVSVQFSLSSCLCFSRTETHVDDFSFGQAVLLFSVLRSFTRFVPSPVWVLSKCWECCKLGFLVGDGMRSRSFGGFWLFPRRIGGTTMSSPVSVHVQKFCSIFGQRVRIVQHKQEVLFDGLVSEDGRVPFSVHVAESVEVVLQGLDGAVRLLEFCAHL